MNIVFLDAYTLDADGLDLGALSSLGTLTRYDRTSPAEIVSRSIDADVIITNKVVLTSDIVDQLPSLKYIIVAATGYNVVDVKYARDRGIPVSNVSGYSTEGVVQHTFALILGVLNQVGRYKREVDAGSWAACADFTYFHTIPELSGMTMGIIGYGTIGRRVAEVASAFNMEIVAHHHQPDRKWYEGVEFIPIEDLYRRADIISLHAPLNESTREIINRSSLSAMKSSAILINTGRGGLINEHDLLTALNDNAIAGAGLDVLSTEPPIDNILINHPLCYITPHIAWASRQSRERLLQGIILNLQSYQHGKIANLVN